MSTRATAVVGLASFALIVVAGLIEPLWLVPGTNASPREVAAYVGDYRTGFLVAVFVFGVAMAGFLAFSVGLWSWLRRRPGVAEPVAATFVLGVVSLCTVVFAGFAVMLVFAYRAPAVADPRLLYDLCFGLLAISGIPTALALGSYAWIVLGAARPLPAWTGWVAALAAAAHVLIAATFFFEGGFFSLEGGVIVAIPTTMFLWLVAASFSLLRLAPEAPSAAP
jgi:hypothetical protein